MAAAPALWHFPAMTQDPKKDLDKDLEQDRGLSLAAEFPATDQATWRKLVEAALKGASFEKRLVSQTYDGLRIEPLYARAAGADPVAGRPPGTAWRLMQRVDHPDPAAANAQVAARPGEWRDRADAGIRRFGHRERIRPRAVAGDAGPRARRRRARCRHHH